MRGDIKPIETVYKGYRFRSRLEARWAVFFDAAGVEWTYEAQGYDLDGKRYLPDFYLPKLNMHVEIKPGDMPVHMPGVYMAGRMGECSYRPFDIGGIHGVVEPPFPRKLQRWFDGYSINYTGPFATSFHDHDGTHGIADCCNWPETEISVTRNCWMGVQTCDVFFALFEDLEAFGTLVEIGWASAFGKKIVVGFAGDQFDGMTAEDAICRDNEIWFAAQMGRSFGKVLCGSRQEVLSGFKRYLQELFPCPREIDLINRLHVAGENACIVYGDPVDAFEGGTGNIYEPDARMPTLMRLGVETYMPAATLARQARFEHGASG